MKETALVVERILEAPVKTVWKAMTHKEAIKQWSFDMDDFSPEVGFEFHFEGCGSDGTPYRHTCVVLEVIPEQKLVYSWRYDNFPGDSVVTWELFTEDGRTRVKLTHEGLETMAGNGPDFARNSFEAGWNDIIGNLLKKYVEAAPVSENN